MNEETIGERLERELLTARKSNRGDAEPLRATFAGEEGDGRWFEAELPRFPGWVVAGLFFEGEEGFTLGELRFLPNAGRTDWFSSVKVKGQNAPPASMSRPKGKANWSREAIDVDDVPALTARFLHHGFRLGEFIDAARSAAAGLVQRGREDLLPDQWAAMLDAAPARPGRGGRDDLFYATWAELYVQKAGSRSPIAELAKEHPGTEKTVEQRRNQIRDWIREARSRELLTRLSSGRPGGTLTEDGRRALKRAGR